MFLIVGGPPWSRSTSPCTPESATQRRRTARSCQPGCPCPSWQAAPTRQPRLDSAQTQMAWLNDGGVQGLLLGGGGVLVWALALYVASRAPTRRAPMLAALAMLCLAAYLTGEALGALAPDPAIWSAWLRRTWWAPSLALPAWLVLTLALAADEGAEPFAARLRRIYFPLTIAA